MSQKSTKRMIYPQKKCKVKNFEVYLAKDSVGNVVYVGSGVTGRSNHCVSGTSHVYGLNQMHFSKENVSVEIYRICETKEESLKIEETLIKELSPIFNTRHNKSIPNQTTLKSKFIKIIYEELNNVGYQPRNRFSEYFINFIEKLLLRFKISSLIDGVSLSGDLRLTEDNPHFHKICRSSKKLKLVFNTIFIREKSVLRIKDTIVQRLEI